MFNKSQCVSATATFLVMLFLALPILGIATSGMNPFPEDLDREFEPLNTQNLASMNTPGSQENSIFTHSSIANGNTHTCAIADDSSLYCWGLNLYGQLGDGTNTNRTSPTRVDLGVNSTASSVVAGSLHTCAILNNGSVSCWGYNSNGPLGDGTTTDRNTPTYVDLGDDRTAVAIAAGGWHTCAILDNGSVSCWGGGGNGEVGAGTTGLFSSPVNVNLGAGRSAVAIDASDHHTCAIIDNGSVKCWGNNEYGIVSGQGHYTPQSYYTSPYLTDNVTNSSTRAVAVALGADFTCVLLNDGAIKCWGYNYPAGFGTGGYYTYTPALVTMPAGSSAIAISVFQFHICSILSNNSLYCWGDNGVGSVGINSTTDQSLPAMVDLGGSGATVISAGGYTTCAAIADGSLKCWGLNNYGQVGDGTTTNRLAPTDITLPGDSKVRLSERDHDGDGVLNIFDTHMPGGQAGSVYATQSISAGGDHSCAILDNGSINCWGSNGYGELGYGSTGSTNIGVNVTMPTGRTAVSVSVGGDHTCAIMDNGSLYCWGANNHGQIGDGSDTSWDEHRYVPTAVLLPSASTAVAVSAGQQHTCAIVDNGSVYCWGNNFYGQLGDGSTLNDNSTPSLVLLTSSAIMVSSANDHTCALLENQSVYCWGNNPQGQFGDGTTISSTTPTPMILPLSNDAVAVSAGGSHNTCVMMSNGSVYCTGSNGHGQLGDGTTTSSTYLVQSGLPGGRSAVAISNNHFTCALLDNGSVSCWGYNYYGQLGNPTHFGQHNPNPNPLYTMFADDGTALAISAGSSHTCAIMANASAYCWGRNHNGQLGNGTTGSPVPPAAGEGTHIPGPVNIPSGRDAGTGDVDSDGDGIRDVFDDFPNNPARAVSCSAGSYGRYVCADASPGYYVSSTGSMFQDACSGGTYNTNAGSTSSSDCISTSAGHYSGPGSGSQTECAAGTYQPSTGQSSCIDASAGYFVPSTAATSQIGCAVGTYQPSTGQSSCIDASAGYYVSTTASASQTACAAGTYQSSTGQSSCIDASAGHYVALTGSTSQNPCSTGTYQPNTGRTSCFVASAGHYVDSTGAISQTACPAGTYNPNSGSTSSSVCLDTDAGYYSNSGSSAQTACAAGTYQPNTGQPSCIDAPAGAYVSGTAATSYSSCQAGAYQPSTGQTSCLTSEAGYYVPEPSFPEKATFGVHHSCYLYDDGSVRCSGYNEMGQLGDGTTMSSSTQVVVDLGGATATDVSSGYWHTCALLSDGQILCWGQNTQGQLGDGTTNDSSSPVSVNLGSGTTALQLSSGGRYTCALVQNYSIACWGQNAAGQLGDNSTTSSTSPVYPNLPTGRTATQISAGASTTCAILDNASAMCWGDGGNGRLGSGVQTSSPDSLLPVYVALPSDRTATSISIGYEHGCAILDNASAMCWGHAQNGAIGNGTGDPEDGSWDDSMNAWSPSYVSLPSGRTAQSISAAREYTCAILDDDSIACWGDNEYGKIGDGTTVDRWSPVIVDIDSTYSPTNLTTGYTQTCLVMSDNSVFCWGYNGNGEFGNGNTTNSQTPVLAIQPVGASAQTACSGATYNTNTGSTSSAACIGASPGYYVPMPGGIWAGNLHTCAIDTIGDLYCWGHNDNGILGLGVDHNTLEETYVPTKVNFSTGRTVVSVSMGHSHTCAILDNGSVNCWGTYFPHAGPNSSVSSSNSPIFIDLGIGRTAVAIASGTYHMCVILDDGSLWCFGYNSYGQIGNNSQQYYHSDLVPVYLGSGRTAVSLSLTSYSTCVILDDNSLKCWGQNTNGQLGDGTTTNTCTDENSNFTCVNDASTASTIDLGTGRYAIAISGGNYHTCALLDDSSLKCWGSNSVGRLGDGTSTQRLTPTAVNLSAGTVVTKVSAGGAHTCAIISDGSLLCWGSEESIGVGQYSDSACQDMNTGASNLCYSPVSVNIGTGRTALYIELGNQHTCAILDDATYWCWGREGHRLGVSSDDNHEAYFPEQVLMPSYGAADQTACSAGTYQPDSGQSSCLDADAGYYVSSTASTSQAPCAAGTYQPDSGQSSCLDAPAGSYVATTGATSATLCSIGTYQDQTGQTSCIYSPPGYYVDTAGSASATPCPAGTYNPNSGESSLSACDDADVGYYSNSGSSSQTACAVGTYQNQTGQASCTDASSGHYVDTTAATNQTACAAGTYQPNTGQTSCTNASAGHYVGSTGSASQTACALGTYQPNTGQSSCIYANTGNYVNTTAATSQTPCSPGTYQNQSGQTSCIDADAGYWVSGSAAGYQDACSIGTYQPSTGQSSCLDADAGYYVNTTASTNQTACLTGTYQPNTGQTSCIDASAGYYVDTTAATSQTACVVGTYQASTGQTFCVDADAGYYVPSNASIDQTACAAGTYQPNTGQTSCLDADAGYYVASTGSSNQTACASGTYQPSTGQTSCLDAPAGTYVDTMGATSPTDCSVGTYQPLTGQTSCLDASPGYYVATTASTTQIACGLGTYQPNSGQISCIDASPGNYVNTTASTNQTACDLGTYQPDSGQSSCLDAPAGTYVDTMGAISSTDCSIGSYQNQTGQISCIDADAGYHVPNTGSTNQTICPPGTYQPNTGQAFCIDASAGYYVPDSGALVQTPCALGTYQPLTGQTSCIDSDAGYYVDISGSASQYACDLGTYQNQTGQSNCLSAPAGHYVNTTAATEPVECIWGTFQPNEGMTYCFFAAPGHYVGTNGSAVQTPCPSGTYNPLSGSITLDDCIEAGIGHYVPLEGSSSQLECAAGTYQNITGQSSCNLADEGYYVPSAGSWFQVGCTAGTYQPSQGQISCHPASVGHYVPDHASPNQYECDLGSYQNQIGQSSCISASIGYYVNTTASTNQTACPPDFSTTSTGSDSILDCFIDTDGDNVPDIIDPDDDNDGYLDNNDDFPLDDTEWLDTDGDGIGNNADSDDDNDGWDDITEQACGSSDPLNASSVPDDNDDDGICDVQDPDDDNDSFNDVDDAFPFDPCAYLDTDGDGMPNWLLLNCVSNLVEDDDDDNDGYNDSNDTFPEDDSEWIDTDGDGIGNNADTDDDGDTVPDAFDAFPLDWSEWFDTDSDGIGNNADTDDDNDGTLDGDDDFPLDSAADTDTDNDGLPDTLPSGYNGTLVEDLDDDGDGVLDVNDEFPLDSTEWVDTDGDGTGNNADADDDDDGWSDNDEFICGTSTTDANDVPPDSDGDGICDSEDDDSGGAALIIKIVNENPALVLLTVAGIIILILTVQATRKKEDDTELLIDNVED